jgi:hypothetical protein
MDENGNNNNYLIPANSKKSQLILGYFNGVDFAIFIIGIAITIILLVFFKTDKLPVMIGYLTPAIIAVFLTAPVPNYHNVMTFMGNIHRFFTGRKKYYWKGWCVGSGDNRKK